MSTTESPGESFPPRTERWRTCGRREIDYACDDQTRALADRYCDRLEDAVTRHRAELDEANARYQRELSRRWDLEQERDRLLAGYAEVRTRVQRLERLLPVCGSCRKLRLDDEYREQVLRYLSAESEDGAPELAVCPDCSRRTVPPAARPENEIDDGPADYGTRRGEAPHVISFRPIRVVEEYRNGRERA